MIAALFPGQGSQKVGMGKFLFDEFALARQTFEEASDALKINFKKLCFEGPEADLQLTENTQPALVLVSTATYRVVMANTGIKISFGAGHSVGEYSACVAAGAIGFADALKAVRVRGEAMQKAVPVGEGAMVAVMGLSDEDARPLCALAESKSGLMPIEPANFNSPGQVVLSGSAQAISFLRANYDPTWLPSGSKLKFIPLAVSAPFHSSLMKSAEEKMRSVLGDMRFSKPSFPIVQNISAEPVDDPETLRKNLVAQVSGSVRWTECYRKLKELGATQAVEFGAGKVLSGLAKKIDSTGPTPLNINSLEDLKALERI